MPSCFLSLCLNLSFAWMTVAEGCLGIWHAAMHAHMHCHPQACGAPPEAEGSLQSLRMCKE